VSWSQEQLSNAAVIAKVGRQLGASARDIQIAIMAAIVESGLRNLNYGDRDSIGMFQQRDAWGSRAARLDPYSSARMFFLGGNAGQRGLLDFANRDQMGMGQAAQAVQVSAFPDRYDQHKSEAAGLLGKIGGIDVPQQGTLGDTADMDGLLDVSKLEALEIPEAPSVTEVNGIGEVTADEAGIGEMKFEDPAQTNGLLDTPKFGQPTVDPMKSLHMPTLEDLKIPGVSLPGNDSGGGNPGLIGFAKKFLGTPYVWGGTSPTGFDCSGFTQYVFKKFGVSLPRISADQGRAGRAVAGKDMRPGDLVFWDNSSRNNGADHVGIYIGNGMFINAPRPGGAVEISHLYGDYWARRVL
jgi:hypothetical protein